MSKENDGLDLFSEGSSSDSESSEEVKKEVKPAPPQVNKKQEKKKEVVKDVQATKQKDKTPQVVFQEEKKKGAGFEISKMKAFDNEKPKEISSSLNTMTKKSTYQHPNKKSTEHSTKENSRWKDTKTREYKGNEKKMNDTRRHDREGGEKYNKKHSKINYDIINSFDARTVANKDADKLGTYFKKCMLRNLRLHYTDDQLIEIFKEFKPLFVTKLKFPGQFDIAFPVEVDNKEVIEFGKTLKKKNEKMTMDISEPTFGYALTKSVVSKEEQIRRNELERTMLFEKEEMLYTLIVRNLPTVYKSVDLLRLFRKYNPKQAFVATFLNGNSRGVGYVDFVDQAQAVVAYNEMSEANLDGHVLLIDATAVSPIGKTSGVGLTEKKCFICGSHTHLSKDCPTKIEEEKEVKKAEDKIEEQNEPKKVEKV
ncbi:hypothetical protein EIN_370080 [Entamoeba invadens IP1]|uniref:CCHC-type domain-containing protein n=1 Tax=Entamoeba invadens IP1 TaxID=370355 RepID=A0A0A1UBT7_ENTIV|nr:hypothetical protein EIN_370080 [Entamoeba invadens IP1]ELP92666.1 hypothetical protein EIN_370080 [Entamoeba invadens IP1]|eukprot:XP_004259437.1 hypothetical protein EIN_370080 [Entamoeba invadens IP1]